MIPDGQYTAVVDRIEDDLAVLEVTAGDDRHGLTVDADELPAEARGADAVLQVSLVDGTLVNATYDRDETEDRSEEAQSRFDRLSRRPPGEEGDN